MELRLVSEKMTAREEFSEKTTIPPHMFPGTLGYDIFCSVGRHVQHF
jgi:hypothetical protein